jgi:hypothetical protein
MTKMDTKNKLTNEQKSALLEWIAADYDWRLIRGWFRDNGWPEITRANVSYYRKRYSSAANVVREERYREALGAGLAIKAERVKRLKKHADELESIKWEPDKNGRLWNEKAWRETLTQIAEELGQLKQQIEHSGEVNIIRVKVSNNEQADGN